MEDAIDAFYMIFAGGQSWLPSWLMVYTLSVGLCFYSGKFSSFNKLIELNNNSINLIPIFGRDMGHKTNVWHC